MVSQKASGQRVIYHTSCGQYIGVTTFFEGEKSIENSLEAQKFFVVCLNLGGCHHPNLDLIRFRFEILEFFLKMFHVSVSFSKQMKSRSRIHSRSRFHSCSRFHSRSRFYSRSRFIPVPGTFCHSRSRSRSRSENRSRSSTGCSFAILKLLCSYS